MREQTDLQLVSSAQAGDAEAYGQLFERYQSKIYNFAYSILGQAEDARDVTQDAFIRVFEALPGKKELDFSPYIYRTARNLSYDIARARGRYIGDPDTTLDAQEEKGMEADPERTSLFHEQQEKVREAVAALSGDYRAVLTMREIDEMSYQQIADALGMPRNTVGVVLSRARLKFRGAFRMQYVDADKLAAECKDMLPKLSAYIDDELSPAERAKADEHLDGCPLCRLAMDEMREATKSYRGLIPLVPPVGLKADVFSRLPRLGPGPGAGGHGGGGAEGGAGQGGGSEATGTGAGGGEEGGYGGGEPEPDTSALADTAAEPSAKTPAGGVAVKKLLSPRSPVLWVLVGSAALVLSGLFGLGVATGWGAGTGGPRMPATVPWATTLASSTAAAAFDASSTGASGTAGLAGIAGWVTEAVAADTEAPPTPEQSTPDDGVLVHSDTVTLRWHEVSDPSGVSYAIEVEQWVGGGEGWQSYASASGGGTHYHANVPLKIRWRLWAVDGAGNRSQKTPWWIVVRAAEDGGDSGAPSTGDETETVPPSDPGRTPGGSEPSGTPYPLY